MHRKVLVALMILAVVASCGEDDPQAPNGGGNDTIPAVPDSVTYHLKNAIPGVTFESIVDIQNAGDGSGRLFVVEQRGRIMVVDSASTTTTKKVFLDISSDVSCPGGVNGCGEKGLLGLAFHPDYETNGYFYVYYSPDTLVQLTRLSRFRVSGDPDAADAGSEQVMLTIQQFSTNHNGGAIAFGEGTELFVALGDGGGGGDPQSNGQNPRTLLGSILRIDVGMSENTQPYYGIPGDNPYEGHAEFAEEIYAIGLRNPWRISYDHTDMRLWAGDVGQGNWEEIDIVERGGNYGWNCREGNHNYVPPAAACTLSASQYDAPVWEYRNDSETGAITGGYVYRGPNAPSLTGLYVYADYVSGDIWALDVNGGVVNMVVYDAPFPVSTFGVGEDGELYIADYSRFAASARGIYRIVETPIYNEP